MSTATRPTAAPTPVQASAFPWIDARTQDCITDEQAQFFRDNGLLVIRNLVRGEELAQLQSETQELVDRARAGVEDPDFLYREHEISGKRVPFRVEYVIDKRHACAVLLGHPFILRSVEKLQGRNFIPTWDSMVFKNAGNGVAIPWHRDSGTDAVPGNRGYQQPIFNVDFYLDRADLSNCLWGILGSNRWDQERANHVVNELNQGGFQQGHGSVPITMEPGDVILHNITALHGSPPSQSALRRVLYFEFRPGEFEREVGPHRVEYGPLKQQQLLECLQHRARSPYAAGETPFHYRPDAEFAPPVPGAALTGYRFPHEQYWRT
jgi:phytanoyl-CoA hydroxylase